MTESEHCQNCEKDFEELHGDDLCYDCWVDAEIDRMITDRIGTDGKLTGWQKDQILVNLFKFYISGYDPFAMNGQNWNYDGSTPDLWAELMDIIGDKIKWE